MDVFLRERRSLFVYHVHYFAKAVSRDFEAKAPRLYYNYQKYLRLLN